MKNINTVQKFLEATDFKRGENQPSKETLIGKMKELKIEEDNLQTDILSFFLYDMEQDNTIENNKLIAEFMGLLEIQLGYICPYDNTENDYYLYEHLKFNTSWDWLMPVVKKCREESNAEDSHWESVYYSLEGCDIDVTYQAVVEFIKEYNKDYKTCDRCCFDIVDDDGDIMEHICIDDKLF